MTQGKPAFETVATVVKLPSGAFAIRPGIGKKIDLSKFSRTDKQVDGSILLKPMGARIEMRQAVELLGVPYSTLLRLLKSGIIRAAKRSRGRWSLDLASVLQYKSKTESDPHFWDQINAAKTAGNAN